MGDMHKNKMCILNLYFPFSSPRLNDVRLVYIIYSLSVNTGVISEFGNQQGRRQKTKLLILLNLSETYITKLLKTPVFLSNNPEIP